MKDSETMHSIKRLFEFLVDIPIQIKWFCQRGRRGWADCDWWNMDNYLIGIILPMLKELKKNGHGYPGIDEADTPEKWDAILDHMILGFEVGKRVIDDEYFLETNADILTRTPTSDEVKLWGEKAEADQKIFDEGMKLFARWYLSLWD